LRNITDTEQNVYKQNLHHAKAQRCNKVKCLAIW